MARIYANENFPLIVIECLRQMGHDVLTTHESGMSNQSVPDEDVLTFAISENRTVLTFNRKDFFRLYKLIPVHAGIIACKEDIDFEALAQRIHEAIKTEGGNLESQLIRVNRPNH